MVELIDFHETKYPEKEFTGKLLSHEIKTVGEKENLALVLTFENPENEEEPTELAIRGIDKRKEDGTISDFYQFGKFIKSLRKLGIRPDLTEMVFSTNPSLLNKTVTMTPIDVREVKKEGEDTLRTYRDWALTKIEGYTAQPLPLAAQKGKVAQIPSANLDEMIEKWAEFLVENLTGPTNENGIIKLVNAAFPKSEDRKPYSETRKASLQKLVSTGRLTINDKAQYVVV